jgi:hypothetical protein
MSAAWGKKQLLKMAIRGGLAQLAILVLLVAPTLGQSCWKSKDDHLPKFFLPLPILYVK